MPRKVRVRVFDHLARNVVRHVEQSEAADLISRGICFRLSDNEIALNHRPGRAAIDQGKPDRSLTVGPAVVRGAADEIPGDVAIIASYRGDFSVLEIKHRRGKQ